MANVINAWLASYLIAIAEDHGANVPSIPSCQKPKKVQLTEWLTYVTNNDDELLWAKISDKELSIPIRFSKKAIGEYNRLNHKRITQHKTAIVSIKDFKPFFTRVPRGGNMKLTSQCVLAFDCDSISLLGSYDEALFGSPRAVETNNDLRLWSEGLRQDGGGGNVLKQRKDAKQATVVLDTVPQPILVPPKKSITIPPPKQDNQTRNINPHASISNARRRTSNVDLLQRRERLFRGKPRGPPCSLDATALLMDEEEVPQKHQDTKESVTGNLCDERQQEKARVPKSPCEQRRSSTNPNSSQPSPKIQSRESSPGVPITNWSPSPSPTRRKPRPPLPGTSWAAPVSRTSFALSSHPTSPTPEQRQRNTTGSLPPSSPPPGSEVIAHETVLLPPPTIPQPSHDKYPVIRKVPRPQPVPVNESDFGPTQILVPNSDTSLSFSQSQPLSQSQSHSLMEVPESSQPVVLSQLSVFSKLRKGIDTTNPFVERASDPDIDDGRDTAAKADPLFFGTFDEDAPYEGDQSSLDHAHEESLRQIYVNGDFSQPHPTEKGIADGSIIVQPTVTQRQTHDHNQTAAEAQHDTEPLSVKNDNHDSVTMEVIQDPDEDDAQIHCELSSSSYSSQPRNAPQHHSPPRDAPSGGIGAHADAYHSQSTLNSSTAVTRRPTPKGDDILNGTPGMGVGVVQHDADAWSAPSFLRPSSSNNIRIHRSMPSSTDADPHVLGKLKTANRNLIDRRPKASLNREAFLPRSRPRVDQNQAPGEAYVARQPKIPTQAQKKTPPASVLTSLQSRPNKRSKDVNSDPDGTAELSLPHAKKRRVEGTASKIARVKTSVLNNGRGVKLKGYSVELSGFMLDEISQPVVSWLRVKDILLKTSRDREEDA